MNPTSFAAALLSLLVLAGSPAPGRAQPSDHRLALVGVGRFAVLADLNTVERHGEAVRMRALQIGEEDLVVAGTRYWGGWSWWAFDCVTLTADRLDFVSVREGGAEGPSVADAAPPYPAAPGGDAAELLSVACDPASASQPEAGSVPEAVRLGRTALTQETD